MAHRLSDVQEGDGIIIRYETARSNKYLRLSLAAVDRLDTDIDVVTYHEIIEDRPQKFYMDIDDVTIDPIKLISNMLDHVKCWFYNIYRVEITEDDIIVTENIYDSKSSYHLIIDNYALVSTYEAKWFYGKVISLMTPELTDCIDKLYKVNQSFRIEGSSKIGKRVYNKRSLHLAPNTYILNTKAHYQSSLVGYVDHCTKLPKSAPDIPTIQTLDRVNADDSIGYLQWFFDLHEMDLNAFDVKINDDVIRLNRILPSYCSLCERVHDSDNAMFTATDDCVTYRCFRNSFSCSVARVRKPMINFNTFKSKITRSVF
jgi:hypothetical protein